MNRSCLILAFALATYGEASLLRGHAESLSESLNLEESGDWAALAQAEVEDQRFLLAQVDETESQLVKLQHYLAAAGKTTPVAALQISATPINKTAPAAKVAAPAAKAPAAKAAVKEVAAKAEDPSKIMASLGLPKMDLSKMKNTMALAPMLAMLKGLYQDSKDRISQQNTREEKSKKWFTEKEADHKMKLSSIEGKFKNHTLSEEFRTNETHDEMRYFNYWERCRQRQHRQFHTNLKIQHAMMTKVKKMIDMYDKALSTKPADQAAAKKQLGQMTGMPEIVFLQRFVTESLAEVRKERTQLQDWATDAAEF